MTWTVWGQRFDTADFPGTTYFQKFKVQSDLYALAVRTWVIAYNNPTFTSISGLIYSDRNGSPGKLLFTSSNQITKAEMITQANGVKEIYFEFAPNEGIPLRAGDYFHLVLSVSGYTGDASSHLAWRKAYPDPVYSTGLPTTPEKIGIFPYAVTIEGADPL